MKHVFSNDMVAHVWAQRSQSEGHNRNRSFSFRDSTIYSYSTPIAAFVPETRKRTACLISERSYSVSTARHISLARRAVSGVPVFVVPHISIDKWSKPNAKKQHRENLAYLVAEYHGLVLRFKRAKTLYAVSDEAETADRFSEQAQTAVNYADMFGLKRPSLNPDGDAATVWAYRTERETRLATPEHQAKLERSRVRREERKAEEEERKRQADYSRGQDYFVRYMMDPDANSYQYQAQSHNFPADSIERRYLESAERARLHGVALVWLESFRKWQAGTGALPTNQDRDAYRFAYNELLTEAERIEWQTARDAAKVAEKAEQISAWRAGGGQSYQVSDVPTMLRVIRGDTVQTSRGADFPLSHALRAIPLVLRCVQTATEWKRNGHTVHLGSFQIDAVDAQGNVTAGCHRVAFTEIARLIVTLRELGHLSGECDCGGLEAHTYSCSFNRPAVLEASTDETL